MPETRLVKKCYNLQMLDFKNGKVNWVSKVRHILFSFGFGFIWEQQHISNLNTFISEFCFRLKASYEQNWHAAISLSPKSNLYSLFKINFGIESYLNVISISKYRAALAQLRCCSHQLRIETGRYKKELRQHRVCTICN